MSFYFRLLALFTISFVLSFIWIKKKPSKLSGLKVSENKRFLVTENDEPFFWLGDTGWKLFVNLNRNETIRYFEDRYSKGYNVIQTHLLPSDITQTNRNGDRPFIDFDPTQLNDAYWQHIDFVVNTADEYGLYLALLPAWARTYVEKEHGIPRNKIFTDNPEAAYQYAKLLGERYKGFKNIIWILGGDTWGNQDDVYDSMALGITESFADGKADQVLISFHPQGGTYKPPATSSAEFYHSKEWLDFNMIQSGHKIGNRNFERIQQDYQMELVKPTLESEPCYEYHPVMHQFKNGVFNAWHLRRRAYWSILAGGFGFTYGGNGIWQMATEEDKGKSTHFNYFWYEALDFEGGNDMRHVRNLFESRPFIDPERLPDQRLIISQNEAVNFHIQCARAKDFSYIIVYSTSGGSFE
ncbi:MAG: DUF4038 domain-containing protein, partial [Bacteroidota bacterium]